jgi:dephospho-CoA kinase
VIRLGLTGSIGMGKSETARMFRCLGVPVCDADRLVHDLYAQGGAAARPVAAAFPGVMRNGAIDRGELGRRVVGRADEIRRLEAIVHPLVRRAQQSFLAAARRRRVGLVVLDIPLLYETGGEARVDYVAVVSAPAALQRARVLRRPGMTEARFLGILSHQVPDREKRRRADFVIRTGLGRRLALDQVRAIVRRLRHQGRNRKRDT